MTSDIITPIMTPETTAAIATPIIVLLKTV